MNLQKNDQAAKLRELALLEKDGDSLQHDDNAVGVLEREPGMDEPSSSSEMTANNSLAKSSKKKRKRNQKKQLQTLENTAVKHNEKQVQKVESIEAKPLTSTLKEKNTKEQEPQKVSPSKERITMDLPVYSQMDAAKAILPTNKQNTEKPRNVNQVQPAVKNQEENETHQKFETLSIEKFESKRVEKILPAARFHFKTNTQVIAITGGKGGVGKSNIACNLGISFSRMGKQVLLMDADLSLANIDVLLGMTPKYNISHVISGEKEINEVILPGPGGLKILPGGSGVEELAHLSPESMSRLFKSLEKLNPVPDIFLLDTAAGIHPNVLQFVYAADQVIVVTTPEPTAYVDAYALIKTLVHHEPDKEIGLLINMAKDSREALHVTRLLMQLCRTALKTGFNNLGFIPRDDEVSKAVRNQQPFLIKSPNCQAAKSLKNIASTILQIDPHAESGQGISGFFRRIFAFRQPDKKAAGS